MRLELGADALELSNDGALDRVSEVGVVIGKDLGLVADLIKDLLPSSLAEELVTLVEAAWIGISRGSTAIGQSGRLTELRWCE